MRPQRRGMALAMADAKREEVLRTPRTCRVGTVAVVGEVPRTGEPLDEMRQPERLLANKYTGGEEFRYNGRHARLRMEPTMIVSWDFTNMARPS